MPWEHAELLDEVASRRAAWERSPDHAHTWLRIEPEGVLCALRISQPKTSGPFRPYAVTFIPVTLSNSETEAYEDQCIARWTTYSLRKEIAAMFVSEMQMDPKTASIAAMLAARLFAEPVPAAQEPPVQDKLIEAPQPEIYGVSSPLYRGAAQISVEQRGGMLYVRTMLPCHKDFGGGYGEYTGFIRDRGNAPIETTIRLFRGEETE
jgi:hypothetical protein